MGPSASSRRSPPRRSLAPPPRPPRRPRRRSSNSRRTPLFLDMMKQNTTYTTITIPPNIGKREIVGAVTTFCPRYALQHYLLILLFIMSIMKKAKKYPGLADEG